MYLTQSSAGKNQWWRYLATLTATLLSFVAGHVPLLVVVGFYAAKSDYTEAELERALMTGGLYQIGVNANFGFVLMLLPFVIALAVLLLCIRLFHRRSLRSVLTSRQRFDPARVGLAALIWFAAAGGFIFGFIPANLITYQFSLSAFLPLLLTAVLLLPLQVAAEEILFRGYLMQGIARFFAHPIWPLVITTLAFAAVHLSNPDIQNGFVRVAPIYLLLSLFFGLLTVLDGGLELPIGAHLGNNLFTALILSTSDGAMNTASVFQTQVSEVVSHIWVLLLAIPVTLLLLHLKYRFDWAQLFRRIDHLPKPQPKP